MARAGTPTDSERFSALRRSWGLYQEGPEIVLAVVPRLAAPEQRSEEGMELPKGLVHLLESRCIHFPASPAQAFLN